MKLTINITNTENIGNLSPDQVRNIEEIVTALIQSGGLTGIRGGKTILHFDAESQFMGVQLDYWPFRRRKK